MARPDQTQHDVSAAIRLEHVRVQAVDVGGNRLDILDLPELMVPAGALTVISGPSGSGKSTLLNVIAGITPAGTGAIHAFGETVSDFSEARRDEWRRTRLGMVFQDFNLVGALSPLDNILLPARFGKMPAGTHDKAAALMAQFGLTERTVPAHRLSRGEQQRVAMARALLFDPQIILADEPTASLDADNAAFVIDRLDRAAKAGRVVIVASHDPQLIARADRLISLSRGRLVGEGVFP